MVNSKFSGNGYGREILTSAVNKCLAEDYKKIYLEVESENWPALRLYESDGFRIRTTFDYMKAQ